MSEQVNFTQALIAKVQPPQNGKRIVLRDSKIAGLVCRISGKGVKTFSVFRRTKGGQPERVTLGRFPDVSVEQARSRAIKIIAAITDGKNPAEVRRAHRAEPTFEEFFNEYLERYSKHNKRSWKTDEDLYRLYLKNPLGKKKRSAISKADLSALHSSISRQVWEPRKNKETKREPAYKKTTANRVLSLVSAVFRWSIRTGQYSENPAQGLQKNPENQRTRFLLPEELSKFFKSVAVETNTTVKDYVLLSLYTGARRGNIVAMRWDQISFRQKIWCIPRSKNNEPVIVPLTKEALAILKARQGNNSEFVFPGPGKHGHIIEPRWGWRRILKRAGINNLRIHDLRRTLGSWQAITGSSTAVIGKSLGHKTQQATAIYARLTLDPVRESVERATQAMFSAAKLKKIKGR